MAGHFGDGAQISPQDTTAILANIDPIFALTDQGAGGVIQFGRAKHGEPSFSFLFLGQAPDEWPEEWGDRMPMIDPLRYLPQRGLRAIRSTLDLPVQIDLAAGEIRVHLGADSTPQNSGNSVFYPKVRTSNAIYRDLLGRWMLAVVEAPNVVLQEGPNSIPLDKWSQTQVHADAGRPDSALSFAIPLPRHQKLLFFILVQPTRDGMKLLGISDAISISNPA